MNSTDYTNIGTIVVIYENNSVNRFPRIPANPVQLYEVVLSNAESCYGGKPCLTTKISRSNSL